MKGFRSARLLYHAPSQHRVTTCFGSASTCLHGCYTASRRATSARCTARGWRRAACASCCRSSSSTTTSRASSAAGSGKVTDAAGSGARARRALLLLDELHESAVATGALSRSARRRGRERSARSVCAASSARPQSPRSRRSWRIASKRRRPRRRPVAGARRRGAMGGRRADRSRAPRRATAAMREAGAVYLPERLHAVRIALKKLRYAVELAAEIAGAARNAPAPAAALKRAQELLGRMHDLQVLIDRVRQVQASLAPPNLAAGRELDAIVDDARKRLPAAARPLRARRARAGRDLFAPSRRPAAAVASRGAPARGACAARGHDHARTLRAVSDSPRPRRGARRGVARRRQAAADRRGDVAPAQGGARPRAPRRDVRRRAHEPARPRAADGGDHRRRLRSAPAHRQHRFAGARRHLPGACSPISRSTRARRASRSSATSRASASSRRA